jgi:hypothetical protein
MEQNRSRSRNQDMPDRSSNMEQAEGSREPSKDTESIRNREEDDLGTSSDRAMFDDRESAEERDTSKTPGAGEQGAGTSHEGRPTSGGITNRPLDRERSEQDRLPSRGRSRSDSER